MGFPNGFTEAEPLIGPQQRERLMYDFGKIKLVVWDLDYTLWQGTLSEGAVEMPEENLRLVKRLTDIGIVNSICSKNDRAPVEEKLKSLGLLEDFVFTSINWDAKGLRVKQLIEDMQLRPVNVLFLDDNPSNRGEVAFCCPGIMTAGPEILPQLLEDALRSGKSDPGHKRLQQYRLLETKRREMSRYRSNEEFLLHSDVRVVIGHDCLEHLDRIHDLIQRSNQLNFTKVRSSKEELTALLGDPVVEAGYVSVTDRFGDYGIVGFYAVRDSALEHFAFSCRILGMGVEQYVYNLLGRPKLDVQGDVIGDLTPTELPRWINQSGSAAARLEKMEIGGLSPHSVLVKGPCDLTAVYPFIQNTELFDTEFTYVARGGFLVESTGHTTHIVEAGRLSDAEKRRVTEEVPFADPGMYDDSIFRRGYKVVFISILQDANLGVYHRRGTGERIAFLPANIPMTDPENWPKLIAGACFTANFRFTEEILRDFSEKYEFDGRNSPEQIVENLAWIRAKLPPDCTLCVMLGGELKREGETDENYKDRHLVHKSINDAIRAWAKDEQHVVLLDVNRYLTDQRSFYNHFNHYSKPVYYQIAKEMADIISRCTGSEIREKSKLFLAASETRQKMASVYHGLKKRLGR